MLGINWIFSSKLFNLSIAWGVPDLRIFVKALWWYVEDPAFI